MNVNTPDRAAAELTAAPVAPTMLMVSESPGAVVGWLTSIEKATLALATTEMALPPEPASSVTDSTFAELIGAIPVRVRSPSAAKL